MSRLSSAVSGGADKLKRAKKPKANKVEVEKDAPDPEAPSESSNGRPPRRARKGRNAKSKALRGGKTKAEETGEPEAVKAARDRLKPLIKQLSDGQEAISVALVLAIVTQETGHHKAANALIDEFGLDTKLGLKKF